MKTIYTTPTKDLRSSPDVAVREPRYFDKPRKDAGDVIVVGNYPHIVKAYRDAGAKVKEVASVDDLKKDDVKKAAG